MTKEPRRKNTIRSLAKHLLASFVLCTLVISVGLGAVTSTRAAASPPNILSYQGRLLNSSGVPVADATASMIFELYTAASGGTCLWSNSSATCASATARTVTLSDGLFSENLGDTTAATPYPAIADTVFGDNAAVHLQVTINGELLTPRRAIIAAPYALNSEMLDGFSTTQAGGTSALIPVFDSTGNLLLTGTPAGTGVSQGSLYVNPASATDGYAIFGVAVGGTSRLTLDEDGDVTFLGDVTLSGGDLISTTTTFNLLETTAT
ncbi:MAG: hypothetical protein NUV56_03765, partial [Candidatus Uhrbacteria bacterium]|nr:hypothetical protein [Candidatus Uhrbacteria bacterium]